MSNHGRRKGFALEREGVWREDSKGAYFLVINIIKQMGIFTLRFHMETGTESGLESL